MEVFDCELSLCSENLPIVASVWSHSGHVRTPAEALPSEFWKDKVSPLSQRPGEMLHFEMKIIDFMGTVDFPQTMCMQVGRVKVPLSG